jgi:hypothetical protein
MNRIEIEIGMWESAPCPICTKNVDLEKAEKRLYQSTITEWGKSDTERLLAQDGNENWTREWERFMEWLCAEEEAIIIECGGKYYEDMSEDEYEAML